MSREIMIVDDESGIRTSITGILRDEGYGTFEAADSDTALELQRSHRPGLVILDIWLQGSTLDGMELLAAFREEDPNLPVVMISGHGTIEMAVSAIRIGAYDFIEKPFKADRLLLVVDRAMEAARLRRENEELKLQAGLRSRLVGSSPHINQLRQAISKVAPTGSRVLITGPGGSGKEVVARQIHAASRRATAPFVALNCAIMHPDRLEAELFGVAPGVEGPGTPGRVGTFERAHEGTLLLDEVADMPLETQGKIVRALQDQTFERVGDDRLVRVDVRVIASSNRDLSDRISQGLFREDLYYRLNVVPILVASLQERREDIPELVDFFMAQASEATGLPRRSIDKDGMAVMQAYDWPGNVRQLRNVIDWILIMAGGDTSEPVTAAALPPEIAGVTPASLTSQPHEEIMSLALRDARELFERQYLEAQVLRFGGNVSRTATFVGMERSALHRKLRSLGLNSNSERS